MTSLLSVINSSTPGTQREGDGNVKKVNIEREREKDPKTVEMHFKTLHFFALFKSTVNYTLI